MARETHPPDVLEHARGDPRLGGARELKIRRVDFSSDEFLAGVSGEFGLEDFAVYWMICTLIYNRGEAIADDADWISRKFKKVNPRTIRASIERLVSASKVMRNDGELMVNRCRNELETTSKRIRTAHENGSKGGRKTSERTSKTQENNTLQNPPLENPVKQEKHLTTTTNTNYQLTEEERTSNDVPKKPVDLDFEEWWLGVWRKVGRGQAIKAYRTARKVATAETLIEGRDRYRRSYVGDAEFMKHPSTWLNGQCWLDEPTGRSIPIVEDLFPTDTAAAARARMVELDRERRAAGLE